MVEGPDSPADDLYNHKLAEGKKAKGLLHFYLKDSKWHFVSEEEYETRKGELPDLCFAIKSPIEDIASKEWPDLTALAKEVLED